MLGAVLRRALTCSIAVLAFAACEPTGSTEPVPVTRVDGGFRRFDTGPPRDAAFDAFHWADTGPQPPPVLPPQSWVFTISVSADRVELTVDLDARAESGLARAVVGANGRSTNVVFEVQPGGLLVARSAVVMGLPGVHQCSYDAVAIEDFRLRFADPDGDGVHDQLVELRSNGIVTRSGWTAPITLGEPISAGSFVRDAIPPRLALLEPGFVPGLEPIVLVASEPIAPEFMPRLTGPRSVLLTPEVGSSAPSRWTSSTADLPAGHYELMLPTPSDLAGHADTALLPSVAFDVAEWTLPAVDGFDPHVVAVLASPAPEIIGDDAGESPLSGATSLLVRGRAALVFDATPGTHDLQLRTRVSGPVSNPYVTSSLFLYDARGVMIAQTTQSTVISPPGMTPGFEADDGFGLSFVVSFLVARPGRYHAIVELGGSRDPSCTGTEPISGLGMTLDDVVLR